MKLLNAVVVVVKALHSCTCWRYLKIGGKETLQQQQHQKYIIFKQNLLGIHDFFRFRRVTVVCCSQWSNNHHNIIKYL